MMVEYNARARLLDFCPPHLDRVLSFCFSIEGVMSRMLLMLEAYMQRLGFAS